MTRQPTDCSSTGTSPSSAPARPLAANGRPARAEASTGRPRRTLVVVNASGRSGIGERARWVAKAAAGAEILYREGGRLRALSSFIAGVFRTKPELLYAVDNAIATLIAVLVARVVFRARVVVDTGDATGVLARSTGRGGFPGFLAATLVERVGYLLADTIVVRAKGLCDLVRETVGRKAVVIPDGFDPALAGPRDGIAFRKTWGATDHTLVVGLLGSASWNKRLQWCYGRDVVEAIARAGRPDLLGVVIARGNGIPHLERLTDNLGAGDRLRFVEPLEGEALWEQLGGLDVALSTQTNDAVGQSRTTGKLVQYLAAGKFILASRVGTAAAVLPEDMLVEYHGAWDDGYFDRLATRIDDLPNRAQVRKRGLEIRGRSAAFAYPALMPRWERIFSTLT